MNKASFPRLKEILLPASGEWRQQEIADLLGVTQVAVHGWINGLKRPRPLYLAQLALHLDLDPVPLAEAVGYEPLEIITLCRSLTSLHDTDLFDTASELVTVVHKAREQGSPRLSLELAEVADRHIMKIVDRESDSKMANASFSLKARLLVEKGRIYCDSYPVNQAITSMQKIAKSLEDIWDEQKDKQTQGFLYTTKAGINYLQKRHGPGRRNNFDALGLVEDSFWRTEIIRACSIGSGYLGDKERLRGLSDEIENIIQTDDNLDSNTIAYLIEGLGRGQALTGSEEGIQTLERAKDIYEKGVSTSEKVPLRELQLARSQLVAVINTDRNDIDTIEDLGRKAIQTAKNYGYYRYAEDVKQMMQSVLED